MPGIPEQSLQIPSPSLSLRLRISSCFQRGKRFGVDSELLDSSEREDIARSLTASTNKHLEHGSILEKG